MIETGTGDVLGDTVDIHNAVTDQFEQRWFDEKEDMFKGALHSGHDWSTAMRSENYFMADTDYTGAPVELRRLIFGAMTNVPRRQQIHQELEDLCRIPPTVVEFETAIQQSKPNSAAGMSGRSYNLAGRRHQPGIDLGMIETETGNVPGDPVNIHNAVTDQFEQRWFDEKEDMFKGVWHSGHSWSTAMRSENYFMADTEYTGAPAELRRLIFGAMTNVPCRQQIHQELEDLCHIPPSIVEFETAI
jgi:hypothetical protein